MERSRGVDFTAFLADETLRRAFVRSLEVIGEAAKGIPKRGARATLKSSGGR